MAFRKKDRDRLDNIERVLKTSISVPLSEFDDQAIVAEATRESLPVERRDLTVDERLARVESVLRAHGHYL